MTILILAQRKHNCPVYPGSSEETILFFSSEGMDIICWTCTDDDQTIIHLFFSLLILHQNIFCPSALFHTVFNQTHTAHFTSVINTRYIVFQNS